MPNAGSRPGQRTFGRSEELTKNVLNTRHALENHFKRIQSRDAVFRTSKLYTLDAQIKATQRLNATDESATQPSVTARRKQAESSPKRRPAGGKSRNGDMMARTWSSPSSFGAGSSQQSSFSATWHGGDRGPGASAIYPQSMHRFAAAVPISHHPPTHPGADNTRASNSTPSLMRAALYSRSGTFLGSSPTDSPSEMMMPPLLSPTSPKRAPLLEDRQGSRAPSAHAASSPPSSPMQRPVSVASQNQTKLDDLLLGSDQLDEDWFLQDDCSPRVSRRAPDPPGFDAKLGKLMAILGPRYKIMNREKMWEAAALPEMTGFQRRAYRAGQKLLPRVGSEPREIPLVSEKTDSGSEVPERTGERGGDPDSVHRVAWLEAHKSSKAVHS